ncbi:MAG: phosphodiester glycosidase family protein [Christensenellales bacterium]|jgi:exopolysaccharide biosynthesis protein
MRKLLSIFLLFVFIALMPVTASASFLYDAESYQDVFGEAGPWIYSDQDLTVTAFRGHFGRKRFTAADVRMAEGTLLYPGAGQKDPTYQLREMPAVITRRYGSVLGFTGDFVTIKQNRKGVMLREGKVYFDETGSDVLAALPDGSLQVYPGGEITAQQLLDMGVENSWAFGPILVMDGKAYESKLDHGLAGHNIRCSLGVLEKGHLLVITTTDHFTNAEMQELFLSYGCTMAYSMDGGHSSTLIFMGEQLNAHYQHATLYFFQRSLSDMVLIGRSKLVPGVDDPYRYQNIFRK